MTPWWFLSMLVVALPIYLALRSGWNIRITMVAFLGGLVIGAALEGLLSLMTGETGTLTDAVARAVNFPADILMGLTLVVAGALNPERLLLMPRVVEDLLASTADNGLRRLKASLQIFELIATFAVPLVAAIHEKRIVRWVAMAAGSLAITAARMGAGYLHYKDQGIVVIRNDPRWITLAYDVNWSIVAFLQTFIQVCIVYFTLRAAVHLVRQIRSLSPG